MLKANKTNLTWIESFPSRDGKNGFVFFADIEGHEDEAKTKKAIQGLESLRENVDTLIVIPNDKLLDVVERRLVLVISAVVFVDTMFYAVIAPLLLGVALGVVRVSVMGERHEHHVGRDRSKGRRLRDVDLDPAAHRPRMLVKRRLEDDRSEYHARQMSPKAR